MRSKSSWSAGPGLLIPIGTMLVFAIMAGPAAADDAVLRIKDVTHDTEGGYAIGDTQQLIVTIENLVSGSIPNGVAYCLGFRIFVNEGGQPILTPQTEKISSFVAGGEKTYTRSFEIDRDGNYQYQVHLGKTTSTANCQYWNYGSKVDEHERAFEFLAGNRAPIATALTPETELTATTGDTIEFEAKCDDVDDAQSTLHWVLTLESTTVTTRDRLVTTGTAEAELFQFNQAGSYVLTATCEDDEAALSAEATWNIGVAEPEVTETTAATSEAPPTTSSEAPPTTSSAAPTTSEDAAATEDADPTDIDAADDTTAAAGEAPGPSLLLALAAAVCITALRRRSH